MQTTGCVVREQAALLTLGISGGFALFLQSEAEIHLRLHLDFCGSVARGGRVCRTLTRRSVVQFLQSACLSVLGQDTEPQLVPDGCAVRCLLE